ncbi:MAG TPA: Ig-like domain-containing protein [Gemmatimonadales bacterium]|jgi:hypothetical protein
MTMQSFFRVRHSRVCSLAPAAALIVAAVAGACSDSTGSSGVPATVQIVSGDSQSVIVGSALAQPLVVIVRDSNDKVVAGVAVTFLSSDSGTFTATAVTTDSVGQATTTFTAGKRAVPIVVSASVTGIASATFEITATPASPADVAKVSGDGQSGPDGASLSAPFIVQVLDGFGNPIVGVSVTWSSSGGTFVSTDAVTDANGEAKAVLTLGSSSGQETVTAHVAGVTTDATFTATAQ